MELGDVAAGYAAIVATAALALELRRWVESGPRLTVSARPGMKTYGIGVEDEDTTYIVVSATNRGSAGTTITNLFVTEYDGLLNRIRQRRRAAAFVPSPALTGTPFNLPFYLEPGKQWVGAVRQDAKLLVPISAGQLYLEVCTTDRERPYLVRVPKIRPTTPDPDKAKKGA